jgi:hypothetical protein
MRYESISHTREVYSIVTPKHLETTTSRPKYECKIM